MIITRRTCADEGAADFYADLDPMLVRIYRARNVGGAAELDHALERLLPPSLLSGLDRAIPLLAEALQNRRRVLVVADFDADGATSCALVVRALRMLGAADVRYIVPNRFEYGYGLTPEIVALAAQQQPDLLITVDNGISSNDGVRAAHDRGIAVLVTDHHLPGLELPPADAIVNPNQPGDNFPSKNLAGVGVAFYVMLALRAHLRATGWFAEQNIPEPNLARLLDLVALGTVADLVPLDHNNRVLVAQGLARINAGTTCAGIQALLNVARRTARPLTATDLGFGVAPRLNAAGRLEDMSLGIECLLTDDPLAAARIADQLDQINRERRVIEAEMQAQALTAVATLHLDGATLPHGLCLYDASWHQGVVGLVAGRVKDRWHRPTIAFATAGDGVLKGSARSVSRLHIRDALDGVAARHPGLLTKFGGHAMAAGLTLESTRLDEFRQAFDDEVRRRLTDHDLRPELFTDGALDSAHLTLVFAERLRAAGPWGQGFPEPLFDGRFEIVERRLVGERHAKLKLRPEGGDVVEAIAFNQAPDGVLPTGVHVHAVYRLDVNEYRGNRTLQLVIEHMD